MKLYKYTYAHKKAQLCAVGNAFKLVLCAYTIISETKDSYLIEHKGGTKWVLKKGKNIFARPTIEKAMDDFLRRKKKQIKILNYNVCNLKGLVKTLVDEKEQKTI